MATTHDHITTEEIKQDIADTEAEIATMEREMEGLRLTGDRLSHFKADARRDGIQRRQDFIIKLKAILTERGVSDET